MFTIDLSDQEERSSFRVGLDKSSPVRLAVLGNMVQLINMSVGGVAFLSETRILRSMPEAVLAFAIDGTKHRIPLTIRIISSEKSRYHAVFEGLTDTQELQVARLVVHLQKLRIRQTNNMLDPEN